ncbi:MAG TPA: DUF624 domain-containing protein [Lachnospiraceae bacterium]|jgi:uncharacterized membrane protein YesL|nr:DUF624 domain-containing protein [Lachnospiraceae bacterium]
MNRLFDLENPVMVFLGRLADLVWLNILYIICCIPVFTIGAATSALYYVTMKMVKDEEGYITKSYFKAFKDNFKQATLIWLMTLAIIIIFFVDFWILNQMDGSIGKIIFVALFMVSTIVVFTLIYIFPLLAKFENTIKNSLKNALLISIRHLPMTVLLILGIVAPFVLLYFFIQLAPLVFVILFSLIAFYTSYIYRKVFDRYIPVEEDSSETEASEEE